MPILGIILAVGFILLLRKEDARVRQEEMDLKLEETERRCAAAGRINEAISRYNRSVRQAYSEYSKEHRKIERETGFTFTILPMRPDRPMISGYKRGQ